MITFIKYVLNQLTQPENIVCPSVQLSKKIKKNGCEPT